MHEKANVFTVKLWKSQINNITIALCQKSKHYGYGQGFVTCGPCSEATKGYERDAATNSRWHYGSGEI